MIIDDVTKRPGRRSRGAGALTVGVASALALAACGASYETYVDGYWDNGDEFRAPAKSALFDENSVPTCNIPVGDNAFETRGYAQNAALGVLFEVSNQELDPAAVPADFGTPEEIAAEELRRERALGALDTLWQLTHPVLFDEARGIETPEDLAPIKDEIDAHIPDIWDYDYRRFSQVLAASDHVEISSQYFITDEGRLDVEALVNPAGYLAEIDFFREFNGVLYTYLAVISDEGKYVIETEKATGISTFYKDNEPASLDGAVRYVVIDVTLPLLSPGALERSVDEWLSEEGNTILGYPLQWTAYPDATLTFVSDACAEIDGEQFERYYLADYELLEPPVAEEGTEGEETAEEPAADGDATE